MALQIKNKQYVRLLLDSDVNFEIYKSEADRLKVKNATPANIILCKYEELIKNQEVIIAAYVRENKIAANEIFHKSNTDNILKSYFANLYALRDEHAQYRQILMLEKGTSQDFPIMAEFYPDVKDSIPYIIEKGFTLLADTTSIDELYETAKKVKRFGKSKDC